MPLIIRTKVEHVKVAKSPTRPDLKPAFPRVHGRSPAGPVRWLWAKPRPQIAAGSGVGSRLLLLQPLGRRLRSLRRSSGENAGWQVAAAHDADDLHRRLHAAHIDDQHRTGVIHKARVA